MNNNEASDSSSVQCNNGRLSAASSTSSGEAEMNMTQLSTLGQNRQEPNSIKTDDLNDR